MSSTALQSIHTPQPIELNEIPSPRELDLSAIPKPILKLEEIRMPETPKAAPVSFKGAYHSAIQFTKAFGSKQCSEHFWNYWTRAIWVKVEKWAWSYNPLIAFWLHKLACSSFQQNQPPLIVARSVCLCSPCDVSLSSFFRQKYRATLNGRAISWLGCW